MIKDVSVHYRGSETSASRIRFTHQGLTRLPLLSKHLQKIRDLDDFRPAEALEPQQMIIPSTRYCDSPASAHSRIRLSVGSSLTMSSRSDGFTFSEKSPTRYRNNESAPLFQPNLSRSTRVTSAMISSESVPEEELAPLKQRAIR